jgi:hypothetical protein
MFESVEINIGDHDDTIVFELGQQVWIDFRFGFSRLHANQTAPGICLSGKQQGQGDISGTDTDIDHFQRLPGYGA